MENLLKIQTQFLQEGMVLARDVETDELLLVTQETKLTNKIIRHLLNNKVEEVWVYAEIQTDNYKLYQTNFEAFIKLVKLVGDDKPIDIQQVNEIIDNFSNTRSSGSLLRYINGIRKVDEYTYQHSLNVCYLSMMLAKWAEFDMQIAALAGVLHDLGKVRIDNSILNKPGHLDDKEWQAIRRHSYFGYDLLSQSSEIPKEVLVGVLYHHERMDGTGYPHGLKGEQIPEIARVVAIADVFDALTSDRVYHDKKDFFEVLQFMHDDYLHFDLKLLQIFTENMLDILVGESVLLSNDCVGKIVFNNPYRPFGPLIQTEDGFIDLSKNNEITIARVL